MLQRNETSQDIRAIKPRPLSILLGVELRGVRKRVIELVEQWLGVTLLAQHICLEPPWQVLLDLIVHVRLSGDGEDVVEFFKRTLLGLRQPEEARNMLE